MNEQDVKPYTDFVLPISVVSKVDVSRLLSELEIVDNQLTEQTIRAQTARSNSQVQPALSDQMSDFLTQNQVTLRTSRERSDLITQLRLLKDSVPVIHMTFAVPADRDSLSQVVQWLRTSIHPQVVVSVGLQPALVAGVYMRTPNRVHDFSLRAALNGSHDALVKQLEVSL